MAVAREEDPELLKIHLDESRDGGSSIGELEVKPFLEWSIIHSKMTICEVGANGQAIRG
jgi:hypothetical protein